MTTNIAGHEGVGEVIEGIYLDSIFFSKCSMD